MSLTLSRSEAWSRFRTRATRGSASWAAHGRYLAREGAQREDAKGLGFDSARDDINLSQLLAGWQKAGDPRLFRIIVSPENGAAMDLKQHARELVAQMERDLGTRLEWAAIDHHDTDNPHVHILVRGITETGNALSIDRSYIKSGIRDRSQEIASRKLGLRVERDILESRARVVTRDQFTEIDRALIGRADARNVVTFNDKPHRNEGAHERQAQNIARLRSLESMGLARQLDQLSWQISPDLEQTLRQHQLSIDIIKTRARHLDQIHDRRAPLHITELKPGEQVTGRVIGTGLENETTDRRYLMIEGNDGRLHYIRQTPAIEKARGEDRLRIGETVTVSGKEFEKNGRRVTYVQVAEHGKGAVAVTMIAGCFLRRCAQLMVHLGVAHPLRQALLQFVDQPAGCETRRRIPSLQQLLHHLIRNPGFVDLNLRIDRYVQPRSFRYRPLDGGHGVGRTLTIVESSEVWLTLTRSLNFGLATVNP